jgi:uncharacterized membrane protein YkvI
VKAGTTWFQRFLLPGFAFKAVVIGGGYATGREIAEFFVPVGPWGGVAAMALTMVLWSLVCTVTFLIARRIGSADYRQFFRSLLGPGWVAFEAIYGIFFIVILAVYAAAAGAIGEAMFGWPTLAGVVVLMALIAGFAAFGNRSVEWLFKYASFLLYGVYALFVLLAFRSFGDRIDDGFALPAGTDGWVGAGITYASYNVIAAVVILPVLRHLTRDRDAVVAGLLAGPLAIIPALLFFLCTVAWYPGIGEQVLPADFMLRQLGMPLLHGAFQLMIFAALLQSSVSGVHAINERIAGVLAERCNGEFRPPERAAFTFVLLVTAMFAAQQFGLVELIARGYRALAVMLIAIFILPLLTVGIWQLARRRTCAAVAA